MLTHQCVNNSRLNLRAFSIRSQDFEVSRSEGEEVWSPGVPPPPNVQKLATAFPHITSQVKRKYKHR